MKGFIFVCLFALLPLIINAQANNYQMFDNYTLSVEATSVRFFIQDTNDLMWIGSDKGLYSYDGYTPYEHFTLGTKTNTIISCGLQLNNDHLLLGSEHGLLLFNSTTYQYEECLPNFKHDVRSLLKIDDEVWIGCSNGLFIYNLESGEISEQFTGLTNKSKHKMTYSLIKDGKSIYLGSNGNLGRISIENKKYEVVNIKAFKSSFLIHHLLKDDKRNCIWIGQGGSLLQYMLDNETLRYVGDFNVVKSMNLDHENNVIMGTDNGLCVFDGKNSKFIVHDSREPKSLANNVIWTVFKDRLGNIWLGTDDGISFSPRYRRLKILPISHITGTGEGNQFFSILSDSSNNYWMGGTNGLIFSPNGLSQSAYTNWYKMGGSHHHISHNHIRDLYLDRNNNLFVATDYGINRYDKHANKFIRYAIQSKGGKENANWAYKIIEDKFNHLWVASNNGGVFVIKKNKLLSNKSVQIADKHYSIKDGLSGNNVDNIVYDKNGNIWALVHNTALDKINGVTGEITNFPIKDYTLGIIPTHLLSDKDGDVWVGYPNGLIRIDPKDNQVKKITFSTDKNADVLAISEVENSIWISTTNGIWVVDKKEYPTQHFKLGEHLFTSIYYNKYKQKVVLGGTDFIALSKPKITADTLSKKIVISAIYVNNKIYKKMPSYSNGECEKIKLSYNQNNLKIEVSDLIYSKENRGTFVYKNGENSEWISLESGVNSIQLHNLNPGRYSLSIGKIAEDGGLPKSVKDFSIRVTPPWYGTLFAKIMYVLFSLSLIWWIYFYITSRQRMKYEQIEKEESLKQSKQKIDFFSDVAHEFKTPLSLIIAPLGRLIQGTNDEKERNALEMVNQNAMKLNSLIHQAIDYYRDDSKVNIGLLLSKVELVEFTRSIFLNYKEGMKETQIEFIFNTNIEQVYLNVDIVKMESVFNNLLSNACKFTKPGDSIIVSIDYKQLDNRIEIKVSDTGIGISKENISYVFQRFYQSPETINEHEGTGIGLFLVKNYVELHGGEVDVNSEIGEGTTFYINLPVMISEFDIPMATEEKQSEDEEKPLIVVVEDNVAIAEFIYNTFIEEYRCIVAHNGKTGLKVCTELKPDIIITDVMMPVMDGLEMARRLKLNTETSTIPLVFLTAKDDKETELESIHLNIEAFIAKPFDSMILYSRIKQILRSRKILHKKARIQHIASPKTEKSESLDEVFLSKITAIIEDKIDDPDLNVNLLCQLADISSKQLYRKIKQLTGFTAVDYIKSIRMKKAAMYLSNKNFTIAEVMYMVGFSNHSYFAKCFRDKFGKTPRQYIEQQNKTPE